MSELKFTEEQVRRAAQACPQAETMLRELFPEAFKQTCLSFSVGDIVQVVKNRVKREPNLNGLIGQVIHLYGSEPTVGIEFQEDIGGHTASCTGKDGFCYYLFSGDLELLYRKP